MDGSRETAPPRCLPRGLLQTTLKLRGRLAAPVFLSFHRHALDLSELSEKVTRPCWSQLPGCYYGYACAQAQLQAPVSFGEDIIMAVKIFHYH